MKKRAVWLWLPLLAFAFSACKESKEETKTPPAEPSKVESTVTKAVEAVTPVVPAVPKSTPADRAAKLGFAKYLPADTEVVLAFHNGTKTADRVKASKIWKLVETQINGGYDAPAPDVDMGGDVPDANETPIPEKKEDAAPEEEEGPQGVEESDVDGAVLGAVAQNDKEADAGATIGGAEAADPAAAPDPGAGPGGMTEAMGPAMLLGTEFTLAMGKGTGDQVANLLTLSRRMNYFQFRGLAKALVSAAKSGDPAALEEAMGSYGPQLIKDLVQNPQSGVGLVEKLSMPPMYLAFKVAPSDRENAGQQVAAMIENVNMIGDMVEPVKFDAGGHAFEGAKVSGAKISAELAASRADIEQELDAATADRLIAAVAKKDLIVASGTVGDYIVLFIGGSTNDLKIAANPAQSLVGTDALAFADAYASKELAALVYGKKEPLDLLMKTAGGLSDICNGLRDGLAGADGLGDTRDLEALFNLVAEREAALRKLTTVDATGVVAFFDQGLKIESYGGTDSGMLDFKTPNKLTKLGEGADVVMFADGTVDATFDQKSREYVEALVETAYAVVRKVSEVPMTNPEGEQFKQMAALFDEKFRPDVVGLWDAYTDDFGAGLGREGALVVDLNGAMPTIPGLPKPVLENGKIPRVSYIAPVADRAKISGSWDKMNGSLTKILAQVSEIAGQEIPMQKPISSEKNGLITWFFPMPFFNDDFLPSVTVGDKWFAASTSKVQALDLIGKADQAGNGTTGFHFQVNFKPLEKYVRDTYKLYQDNAEGMGASAELPEGQKQLVEDAFAVLGDLDKLTIDVRRENSQLRSTVHFKTR